MYYIICLALGAKKKNELKDLVFRKTPSPLPLFPSQTQGRKKKKTTT